MDQTTIPLTEAGHRLGLSYNQILRRVMVGELRGECVDGKWECRCQSGGALAKARLQPERVLTNANKASASLSGRARTDGHVKKGEENLTDAQRAFLECYREMGVATAVRARDLADGTLPSAMQFWVVRLQ